MAATYRVRAIFDNASFVIPGEDVKVAGVNVGTIDSLDVDDKHRAVVVLKIDDPGVQSRSAPTRAAASRLQSLIGEQYIQCQPTQPRGGDREPAPELPKIKDGQPGAGQYLLPVERNQSPVGADLLNDIMRVPRAAAAAADHQRARRGAVGQRRGAAGRPAARKPGAAAGSTSWSRSSPARTSCSARLTDDSDAVLEPAGRAPQGPRRLHRERRATPVRRPPARATRWSRTSPSSPPSCGSSGRPPTSASARSPTRRPRRSGHLAAQAPAVNEATARPRPVHQAGHPGAQDARQGRRPGPRDVPEDRATSSTAQRARHPAGAAGRRPRRPLDELRRHGRHRVA